VLVELLVVVDEVVVLVEVDNGEVVLVATELVSDGIVANVVVAVRYPSSDLSKSINS